MMSSQRREHGHLHFEPHRLYLRRSEMMNRIENSYTHPSVCIRTHPSVLVRNVLQGNKRRRWTFPVRNGCPGHSRRVGECCFWSQAWHPLHSQFQPRWVDPEPRVKTKACGRPPNLCRHLLQPRQSRESAQSFTISLKNYKDQLCPWSLVYME